MSRIILSRHDNGEEHITVGFDRPLGHYFWSETDDKGEGIQESYMDLGLTPRLTRELVILANQYNHNVFSALLQTIERGARQSGTPEIMVELAKHRSLDYPASNVVLDFSE
jgi:hypothetical protein